MPGSWAKHIGLDSAQEEGGEDFLTLAQMKRLGPLEL